MLKQLYKVLVGLTVIISCLPAFARAQVYFTKNGRISFFEDEPRKHRLR